MKRLLFLSVAACAFSQTPAPPPGAPAAGGAALPDGLYAIFNTERGVIKVQLFEKETPLTVANFVGLAKGTKAWKDSKTGAMVKRPMYNNIAFYRIMMDQMIQAGDPTGKGSTPCGITLKDEIRPNLKFDQPGRLAMANRSAPNTAECEWFITNVVAPPWDGSYTIFGQVVEGQDVVKAISRVAAIATIAKNPAKLITLTIQRVGPEPAHATPAKKAAPPATKKSAAPAKQ
ncbi:Peptidyl-prolyl cis-trans isomerase [Candidatus Sulfopaludibacter sp. SbA3]|nr:Peptidyl-prolyl cis-trans isomerase [Candidatus Sulfopaludibacter sp. SbA3]